MESANVKELTFQERTDEYARRSIASMREDLAALAHARECDGTDENGEPCTAGKDSDNPEAWHDEDRAQSAIWEGPLSIEVRSGWYEPGTDRPAPAEYNILLGTGGPAARIIGDLEGGEVDSARFQFQDWGTPWTDARLSQEDGATLLEYAQHFSFYY